MFLYVCREHSPLYKVFEFTRALFYKRKEIEEEETEEIGRTYGGGGRQSKNLITRPSEKHMMISVHKLPMNLE